MVDDAVFIREDEKKDERVGRIVALMNAKQDWNQFAWEVEALPRNVELSDSEEDVEVEDVTEEPSVIAEEPTVVAEEPIVVTKRGKRKLIDPGVESRKKQLLCQRAAEHNSGVSGDLKTFIEALFTSSFNSLKELVQRTFKSVLTRSIMRWLNSRKRCLKLRVLHIQREKPEHLRFRVLHNQRGKTKTNHHRVRVLQQQREKPMARQLRVCLLPRFIVALGQ